MKLLDPTTAMKTPQLCILPYWMIDDPRVKRFVDKVGFYTTPGGGFTPNKKCPPSLMRHFDKLWKERTAAEAALKDKR